jgi:hypothetical protein
MYHQKDTLGVHYSLPNHKHTDLITQVIEKVIPNTVNHRLEREEYWIKTLGTKVHLGLNKQD